MAIGAGFSTAMRRHGALSTVINNCAASLMSSNVCRPFDKATAELWVSIVHGGCAIIKSHGPSTWAMVPSSVMNDVFPPNKLRASATTCHSGRPPIEGRMSLEYASYPRARKAEHTTCERSNATSTFISIHHCGRSAPMEPFPTILGSRMFISIPFLLQPHHSLILFYCPFCHPPMQKVFNIGKHVLWVLIPEALQGAYQGGLESRIFFSIRRNVPC